LTLDITIPACPQMHLTAFATRLELDIGNFDGVVEVWFNIMPTGWPAVEID